MHDETTSGTGDGPVSRHPFIFHLFLPFLAGLLAAPFVLPSSRLPPAALVTGLLVLILRRRRGSGLLLWGFMALVGIALHQLALAPPQGPERIGYFASDDAVTVEAKVSGAVRRRGAGASVDLMARRVWREERSASVTGGIRLFIEQGRFDGGPGDRIRFRARLRRPRRFGTPGEFDYPRYLARRGIFVTAKIKDGAWIARFARTGDTGVTDLIAAWRDAARRRIETSLPAPGATLVRALVLGDKSGFDDQLRKLLARTGLSHLFAISGLHLGLIGLFCYAAARALYLRSERLILMQPPQRLLPVLLIPVLLGYLLLTGAALPTRRAFLMGTAAALLAFHSRRTPLPHLLAVAAFLMLLCDPLALGEPGFQLSFAGLAGIALWGPPCVRRAIGWPLPARWLATTAVVTLAATLATAPLVLHHFHILAPAGLVTNLFAVPLVGFAALPLGLAGLALCPFLPTCAEVAFQACGWCLESILAAASTLLELPGLGGWIQYAPPRTCLAFGAVALAVLLSAKGSPRARRWQLFLVVAGGWLWLVPAPPPESPTVIPLSVGQGDATLLAFPDGRTFLVDGGGMPGTDFDVGERLVTPALTRLGITELTGVFLSHGHPDHWQGLVHVIDHLPVGRFWSGLTVDELPVPLRGSLAARKVPITRVPPGWHTLIKTGPLEISLFVPPQQGADLNNRSVAVFARWDRFEVLLPGDLEARGVADLVAGTPTERTVTLLKLPHHGSRHSRVELLLDRFRPRLAWVSAGAANPYNLPHPQIVALLRGRNVSLVRTDRMGTLRLRPGSREPTVEEWRQGLFR